jgi:hypothetical protein
MARTDFSKLPIVLISSPRKKFRKLHLFISLPLLAYGATALFFGDVLALPNEEAASGLGAGAGLAVLFEILGHLFERARGRAITIDAEGVLFASSKDGWFEPLSAYQDIALLERVEELGKYSTTSVYMKTLASAAVLNHRDNTARSVVLFSRDMFAERAKDLATCRQISELLGLPIRRIGD